MNSMRSRVIPWRRLAVILRHMLLSQLLIAILQAVKCPIIAAIWNNCYNSQ